MKQSAQTKKLILSKYRRNQSDQEALIRIGRTKTGKSFWERSYEEGFEEHKVKFAKE